MGHTPTPYRVADPKGLVIYDEQGHAIADAKTFHGKHESGVAQANAAFIVLACNCYADMLAALQELRSQSAGMSAAMLAQIDSAIAKAKA